MLSDYRSCEQVRAAVQDFKGYCTASRSTLESLKSNGDFVFLDRNRCETGYVGHKLQWVSETRPNSFYCGKPIPSRDNHHGDQNEAKFSWQIPADFPVDTPCVIRVRYNISTADYPVETDHR